MKNDLVTVLDLGSTKVACLAAVLDPKGEIHVRGVASVPCKGIRKGVVVDLEAASSAVDQVIRKVQQNIGKEISSVVVGVAGGHLEGMNAQGYVPIYPRSRTVTREDILQVINHSRQQVLPPDREQVQALPREFRIDGQRGIQKPIGMSGSRLEVTTYLVTGQTTHLQNIEKVVSMTGRRVDQMVLQPLAAGMSVLTQEEIEAGTAVIDIGGGTTDVAVFSSGSLAFSVSLPVGSQLVTSDLSKLLKTSPEEAERLKLTYGMAIADMCPDGSVDVMQLGQPHARPLQRRVLCEIIESRMREVALMTRQQIEKSGLYGLLPGGIVVTGGGSLLPGLDRLFEETMRHLRVRLALPTMPGASGTSPNERAEFAASLGLARFVMQCGEDDLSPVSGAGHWKEKVKGWKTLLGGRT